MHRKKMYNSILNKEINIKLIKHIFKEILKKYFDEKCDNIKFKINNRLKKTVGRLDVYETNGEFEYELSIAGKVFDNIDSKKVCNGITCKDKYECLIVTLEHEVLHYVLIKNDKDELNKPEHTKEFKKLMKKYFGHSDHEHQIV